MNKQVLANRLLLTFLVILVATTMIPPGYGASAEISGFSVTPAKSAYYVGETPQVLVVFSYKNVANNTALKIEIYNSTSDLVFTITGITLTGDASLLNGTYEQQHSLASNFTEKTGSKKYTAKLIDVSTGYKLAETTFTINVETESIMLLVSWIDGDQNRQVDINEQVTFSIFVQWSFVNESKSGTLYVVSGGNEIAITTVTISAGSGQDSASWQTAFSSKGNYVVTFKLKDANGDVLAQASVTVTVGQQTQSQGLFGITWLKLEHIAIGLLLVIIIVLLVKEKK